jgi:hypothetical protein
VAYSDCHVTQPLILEHLLEIGLDISAGEVNRIIVQGHQRFHDEKDEILRAGLEISDYVNVDDTSAWHKGKNGYCTHIGNEYFAWFETSQAKSRINFLQILRAGRTDYVLSEAAFDYMIAHKISRGPGIAGVYPAQSLEQNVELARVIADNDQTRIDVPCSRMLPKSAASVMMRTCISRLIPSDSRVALQ